MIKHNSFSGNKVRSTTNVVTELWKFMQYENNKYFKVGLLEYLRDDQILLDKIYKKIKNQEEVNFIS